MDKRSWPWKKKSSEKARIITNANDTTLSISGIDQGDQVNTRSIRYVHISAELHTHFIKLEDQVKALSEKLSASESEMTTKDNMIKQHAKVAEEAISGWEKAEAESSALKQQLESVMLLKLTVEDRASHLDGALKECMNQMRVLKEESEQKLQDVIFTRTKQSEKVKLELERKIDAFKQEVLRCSAENDALSRFLQERSTLLMKISEEKSQADARIEVLKTEIQSFQREISSLKYELNIASKELEIRNEEKNMSVRSEGVANKQHVEDAKKIAKLEAECQRLRGLMRKKLPGPAALAQMKLEVENFSRNYGEIGSMHSTFKISAPHLGSAPEYSVESIQQCYKENEFLAARLLEMQQETMILKEELFKRNFELQTSRSMYTKIASKLHSMEAHKLVSHQQTNHSKRIFHRSFGGSSTQNGSNRSLISMSEDGLDEEGSCSESWATTLISDLSQFKDQKVNNQNKGDQSNQIELIEDFLEMERMACLSAEKSTFVSHGVIDTMIEVSDATSLIDVPTNGRSTNLISNIKEQPFGKVMPNRNNVLFSKLQSRIASVFECQVLPIDMVKILKDVKRTVQDIHDELTEYLVHYLDEESPTLIASCEHTNYPEGIGETKNVGVSLKEVYSPCTDTLRAKGESLEKAISLIDDFVVSVCNEAMNVKNRSCDDHVLTEKVQGFSRIVNSVLTGEINLTDYIRALSCILSEMRELSFQILTYQSNEREISSIDCVDKVTLLENKIGQHVLMKERSSGVCTLISPTPENFQEPTSQGFELKARLQTCSSEEFEGMKLEKNNMEINLARLNETIECTKIELVKREQHITDLESQLSSCQKSLSFVETQLKCMTESYNSQEAHIQKLENDMNMLHSKADGLDNELLQERRSHQDDLVKYEHLQEQIERNMRCPVCSFRSEPEDGKTKQEREMAAAAEKLAECQETILLLGRQLNTLRPPTATLCSSPYGFSPHQDHAELEPTTSVTQGTEVPKPPIGSRRQKQRSRSASSSSLSSMLGEKHSRSFGKFFFKGKSGC